MNSHQSRINARRVALDRAADAAPMVIIACCSAVAALAAAVVIGAFLAAIPQLDAVLEQAEQLHGF